MIRYKKYHISHIHKGYQVFLTCAARSYKEAAEKFEMSEYYVRKYAGIVKIDDYFEGVRGYIDSGYIIFEFGRKDLSRKEMAFDELKEIIEEYYNIKKNEQRRTMGIND